LTHKKDAKLIIIIEERDIQFARNEHHLFSMLDDFTYKLRIPPMTEKNASYLFEALKSVGLLSGKLLNKSMSQAAKIICDTERGYRGDLLATLCDVTSNQTFSDKIEEEYTEIESETAKKSFKLISLVTSARLSIPITYICEILNIGHYAVMSLFNGELLGKIYLHTNHLNVSARHYVISEYHVKNILSDQEKETLIVELMKCVSNKFKISEIKKHPLPYRIYRSILNHFYLRDVAFAKNPSRIENIYSICQSLFTEDGIFWLQYGKFLSTEERYKDAEHCYRKGLQIYDSFQIRHALGQVLLKMYCVNNACEQEFCDEGIDLLVQEISTRGEFDPYAYTTLGHGIMDILNITGDRSDLIELLRHYTNMGLKVHRKDPGFLKMVQRGIQMGVLAV